MILKKKKAILTLALLLLAACACEPEKEVEKKPPLTAENQHFVQVGWEKIGENLAVTDDFWRAFLRNCGGVKEGSPLLNVCEDAFFTSEESPTDFFKSHFDVYQMVEKSGEINGLATGYYEPLIRASRTKSAEYPFPIHAEPKALLASRMDKNARYRADSNTHKLLPYWTRAEILASQNPNVTGEVLFWAADAVELFFLQIQGSGRVELPSGEVVALNFANHNGRPYRSVGKILVEKGEMPLEKASMQNIKAWVRQDLPRGLALLNQNPRYVFFKIRESSGGNQNPIGAFGVPLTPEISVAVDKSIVPLGAPLFLKTTQPNSAEPLERFVLAQDTGSAIKGAVRVDYFWGFGDAAGQKAGAMKQAAQVFLLWPKNAGMPRVAENSADSLDSVENSDSADSEKTAKSADSVDSQKTEKSVKSPDSADSVKTEKSAKSPDSVKTEKAEKTEKTSDSADSQKIEKREDSPKPFDSKIYDSLESVKAKLAEIKAEEEKAKAAQMLDSSKVLDENDDDPIAAFAKEHANDD